MAITTNASRATETSTGLEPHGAGKSYYYQNWTLCTFKIQLSKALAITIHSHCQKIMKKS